MAADILAHPLSNWRDSNDESTASSFSQQHIGRDRFSYNEILPYGDKVDEEAKEHLEKIKIYLIKAVKLKELTPGVEHWTSQLNKYVHLYGRYFTKEDHVLLINLMMELISIPNLNKILLTKFAGCLRLLLKKTSLLTREDLTLPWENLYELYMAALKAKSHGLVLETTPSTYEASLRLLIQAARPYFPLDATAEILARVRPYLCPSDMTMLHACQALELFLPTEIPPEHHQHGFKLWFDEIIHLWETYHNGAPFERSLWTLLTRLSQDALGYISWEPYIPQIFTRILRSLRLSVGTQRYKTLDKSHTLIAISEVAALIVNMINSPNLLVQLEDLMYTLRSYYHPSNSGVWNTRINQLIQKLADAMVTRLHREKRKVRWNYWVRDSDRLKQSQITKFVEIMLEPALTALFSKTGGHDACAALRLLSMMRPELVTPPLLDRSYQALETVTEPHRLYSCLQALTAVARHMLSDPKHYPEGRLHLVPLLQASLLGLDPNDSRKTLCTFQLITGFAVCAPLLDCTPALSLRSDLTEEQRDVISTTAAMEDLILQFMDRVLQLIRASGEEVEARPDPGGTQDNKLNVEQSLVAVGISSCIGSLLQNTSNHIQKIVIKKIFDFVNGSVMEARITGKLTAELIKTASQASPELAMKTFLPYFCNTILQLWSDESRTDERLDSALIWNIRLLSETVRTCGHALLPHKDRLFAVLDKILHFQAREGYVVSGVCIKHILTSLTTVYELERASTNNNVRDPDFSTYLPTDDWGQPGDLNNLKVNWHIPSAEEKQLSEEVLKRYLVPELNALQQFTNGTKDMNKEELCRRLNLVWCCIKGSAFLLEPLQGNPIQLIESAVPIERYPIVCSTDSEGLRIDGKSIRNLILETMAPLCEHLLKQREDETNALISLISIFRYLALYFGELREEFDNHKKIYKGIKVQLSNRVIGHKKHLRTTLIQRAKLQHDRRVLNRYPKEFTEAHKSILDLVFVLSISHYSGVRKVSQSLLLRLMSTYSGCSSLLVDRIVDCLSPEIDPNTNEPCVPEHKLKGALYTFIGTSKDSIILRSEFDILQKIWPAVILAQHSQKPTVQKAIETIYKSLVKFVTPVLVTKVSDTCIQKADELLNNMETPTIKDLKPVEDEFNHENTQSYTRLLRTIVDTAENNELQWKHYLIALRYVGVLIRADCKLPAFAVEFVMKNLINDNIIIRKEALGFAAQIFKQQKRSHPTKVVQIAKPPTGVSEVKGSANDAVAYGYRDDIKWLLYNPEQLPSSETAWNKTEFVEKTHWGYYCWPKEFRVYDKTRQPSVLRDKSDMQEEEQVVFDSFRDCNFVAKLIGFWKLEEEKGKDKFDHTRFIFWKGLHRNMGPAFMSVLRPHIQQLLDDTGHQTHEHSHRAAAELITGIVRGMKHWPYQQYTETTVWIDELLRKVLRNMTTETLRDWGICFSTISENRDPSKLHFVFDLLIDSLGVSDNGSFGEQSRLFTLQGALAQQEWRIPTLLQRVMDIVIPQLDHPYKNVRGRLGSLLVNLMMYDLPSGMSQHPAPAIDQFLDAVLPRLEPLYSLSTLNETDKADDEERKKAVRCLKTVVCWLNTSCRLMYVSLPDRVFHLTSLLCIVAGDTDDPDLKDACELGLYLQAQQLLTPHNFTALLHAADRVLEKGTWHSRTRLLSFLQMMVFSNLFTLKTQANDVRDKLTELVLNLIKDEQAEVREMAAVTLSGLLHCGFIPYTDELRDRFVRLSRAKLRKKGTVDGADNSDRQMALLKRHVGVLGLGAIIQAHPYDVPPCVPDVLMAVCDRVNDPQPIQRSARDIMSNFKRTHLDNWQDHKRSFNDDQLATLTDLLVSPNYYA